MCPQLKRTPGETEQGKSENGKKITHDENKPAKPMNAMDNIPAMIKLSAVP